MTIFLESPLPAILCGVAIEAVLGAILLSTRRGVILWIMLGVLVLTILGVVVERLVVTDRERIEATLDGCVRGLEANDLSRTLTFVAPNASHTRSRAEWALQRLQFTSIRLREMKITINRLTSPPTAEARFTTIFFFRDRMQEFPYDHYVLGLIVELQQEGDRWLITDHIEEDPHNLVEQRRR